MGLSSLIADVRFVRRQERALRKFNARKGSLVWRERFVAAWLPQKNSFLSCGRLRRVIYLLTVFTAAFTAAVLVGISRTDSPEVVGFVSFFFVAVVFRPKFTKTLTGRNQTESLRMPSPSALLFYRWLRLLPDYLLVGLCWSWSSFLVFELTLESVTVGRASMVLALFAMPVYLCCGATWFHLARRGPVATILGGLFLELPAAAVIASLVIPAVGQFMIQDSSMPLALLLLSLVGIPVALWQSMRLMDNPPSSVRVRADQVIKEQPSRYIVEVPDHHRRWGSLFASLWFEAFQPLRRDCQVALHGWSHFVRAFGHVLYNAVRVALPPVLGVVAALGVTAGRVNVMWPVIAVICSASMVSIASLSSPRDLAKEVRLYMVGVDYREMVRTRGVAIACCEGLPTLGACLITSCVVGFVTAHAALLLLLTGLFAVRVAYPLVAVLGGTLVLVVLWLVYCQHGRHWTSSNTFVFGGILLAIGIVDYMKQLSWAEGEQRRHRDGYGAI